MSKLEFNVPFQHKNGYIRDECPYVTHASFGRVISPKITLSHGDLNPDVIHAYGSTRVHKAKGVTICSAVVAGLTAHVSIVRHGASHAVSPSQMPLSIGGGDLDPHPILCS